MKYKILIVNNDFPIDDEIEFAKEYLNRKSPVQVTFDVIQSDLRGLKHSLFLKSSKGLYQFGLKDIKPRLRKLVNEGEYHQIIFVYDKKKTELYKISSKNELLYINSWSTWKPLYPETEYTEMAMTEIRNIKNNIWNTICHETMHSFVKRANRNGRGAIDHMDRTMINGKFVDYYKNWEVDHPDGNYARTFKELENHWDVVVKMSEPEVKYKYFSKREIVGLKPEFVQKLDEAREIAGIPFIINSGFRTSDKNERVGGVAQSSHTRGLGVDLRALNDKDRYSIITGLLGVKFNRIGIYKNHIHVDLDTSKTEKVIWYK